MSTRSPTGADIIARRLHNNRLIGEPFARAEDMVRWMGAVQAQDYAGAKWAIGQRLENATDAELDQVFNEGAILRTHVLRPTWHFVMPEDIRWMLELTAPRVNAASAYYHRQQGLDAAVFSKANRCLTKALAGGARLTRPEIAQVYGRGGIEARGVRLAYLLMRAELDGLVCSGGLRGKQFTYALLDDRVPATRKLGREEALGELTRRYFTSHGPAQIRDFAWWSGLAIADAKAGIEMVKSELTNLSIDGKIYWFANGRKPARFTSPLVHLLPNYDEFLIAYQGYGATVDSGQPQGHPRHDPLVIHILILDGRVVGSWRRTLTPRTVTVTTKLLAPLAPPQETALRRAADEYSRFLGRPVAVVAASNQRPPEARPRA